jgi:hypothetical protein
VENVQQESEEKLAALERRHESELRSLKDVYEGERESWISNFTKKQEQSFHEREAALIESINFEKDKELRERERKLKEDFEKLRREDESDHESRIRLAIFLQIDSHSLKWRCTVVLIIFCLQTDDR